MKKILLLIIPILAIVTAAALFILIPKRQPKAEITYSADAFGDYWAKYFFPMTQNQSYNCKHFLLYKKMGTEGHLQKCIRSENRGWDCDFEPIFSEHEWTFQSIYATSVDDYGCVYHILKIRCAVCGESQYRPCARCRLDSPECDGSCLGFSAGDAVEVPR